MVGVLKEVAGEERVELEEGLHLAADSFLIVEGEGAVPAFAAALGVGADGHLKEAFRDQQRIASAHSAGTQSFDAGGEQGERKAGGEAEAGFEKRFPAAAHG